MVINSAQVNNDPRRTGFRGAFVTGLVILVFAAIVFALSGATRDAAKDGITYQAAEAVLGTGDLAVKALAQAVLLAEDQNFGVADEATVRMAIDEAASTLDDLSIDAADLDDALGGDAISIAAAAAVKTGESVLNLLEQRQVEAAGSLLAGDNKQQFESLRDAVAVQRTTAGSALLSIDSIAARLGNLSRFLVAFLVPVGGIVAYRFAATRQLRVAELQLDTRLEAEHRVIRAKDEFIANISHELRTPLTSIYGFSELLLESGLIDPDTAMDLVGMINTESAELGRMVEDLLVSARAETSGLAYSFAEVDLGREAETVIEPLVREGQQIEVTLPSDRVWADSLRVRQIMRNLVSNALRHGGDQIFVEGVVAEDRVFVHIDDDGDGVPAEMKPRLFTRFVHGSAEALTVGSVGLGLAVVKSLAEGMGGGIEYGREGGWTRFTVWLPLASSLRSAQPTTATPVTGGVTIAASTPQQGAW